MNPAPSFIEQDGVVAVVRLDDLSRAVPLTEALVAGGVRAVEFTFTNPDAAAAITAAHEGLGGRALIGAGSVLDAETARVAILAGAAFVVTPTVSLPVIEICNRYGVATVIGALTPTEILTAWQAGATYVKVFPASLGGPRYLRDVRGPLPQVKLIPTGGVDAANAGEFIRAGAVAVALGSNLVDARSVANDDWPTITERAQAIIAAVARARQS
ncbi:MAG: 2-dehydro-3-deoxyphosphogluconate aldolase/4-hydroxy-2-oxoglutarate aldolase [Thermomicrobiales bacterium]|jgi:2-dehydro-3-deoxyphosphogluconate aldolase/(4S)-4-hydroxy-2-oxoglutarate aldolase|nr:2-dehydro-3-deoxyphosphogluconate aldolase/4-hydroxy-2-oxoglutarate aldolase [Thermomicrobiales bacterium]